MYWLCELSWKSLISWTTIPAAICTVIFYGPLSWRYHHKWWCIQKSFIQILIPITTFPSAWLTLCWCPSMERRWRLWGCLWVFLSNSVWRAEWFFTSMNLFMLFQIIKTGKLLVTLWAAEWFFASMCFLCCFKSPKCLNFLSHCQQVKCFSPVWILSCSFKLPRSANFLSHVSNWMVLLQCEFFHVPSSHLESFKRTDKRAHEVENGCCCCCQKMVLG